MADLKPINPLALISLKAHRPQLSAQQYCTLRGQVLAGDDEGAMKGLQKIMRRRREEVNNKCK